ncbi:MAG: glycosyltransferase family 2 protein [Desulfobulbaceae bacterium]|nr:glycosyltransferase family 2 protein [Desulfobulbaceae bacterium]
MVSVIVPTYNRAKYIKRAMDSVLGQTRPPDELIIVDDGSTDNTLEIIEQTALRAAFPVRVLRRENRGAAAARNVGIAHATGDFLCFLDSDDWWDKKKIELQLEAMHGKPDSSISHTREIWFRNGVRVNQKKKHAPGNGHIFADCLKMCVVGMSTVMVKKELFTNYGFFNEALPCCEDYDLWLRVAREQPFLLVDHALTLKEGGRDDQLSVIYRLGMDRYRIRSLCDLLESCVLTDRHYLQTVSELERKCRIYGQGCIKHGREIEGRVFLVLPDKYRPMRGPVAPGMEEPAP